MSLSEQTLQNRSSKNEYSERSPAKVNLSLTIHRKREDGFHELTTQMAPISLCDVLHFEKAEEYSLHCDFEGVPLDESNLVTKALRIFEREAEKICNWRVTIEKVIPHGAGLAGGSSNAAAMLRALNVLEDKKFSKEKLAEMAGEIGSDVAFFVYNQVCVCEGRGEKVTPVDIELDLPLLLLKPSFGVSTPTAYKAWQSSNELPGVLYAAQELPWGLLVNDLERPVFEKHRFLAELKHWLLLQPEVVGALMSGSGSTCFAVLKSTNDAKKLASRALEELDPSLWTSIVKCG